MIVLGIDPGTAAMGYGIVDNGACGVGACVQIETLEWVCGTVSDDNAHCSTGVCGSSSCSHVAAGHDPCPCGGGPCGLGACHVCF